MPYLPVDVSAVCWSAFHGLGDLTDGEKPTAIAFGFFSKILTISKRFNSCKFAFCFDSRKNHRARIFPEYKLKRHSELSDEEIAMRISASKQIKELYEILPTVGFKNIYRKTGAEADDLLSSFCLQHEGEKVICSSDKDMLQCLTDDVSIYNLKKNVTKKSFMTEWGVDPFLWRKIKALAGCSTDEVPGIKGVGEPTACKYITGQMKPSGVVYTRIESEEGQKIYQRNKELVYLPFRGKIIDMPYEKEALREDDFLDLFERLKFYSFLNSFQQWQRHFNLT